MKAWWQRNSYKQEKTTMETNTEAPLTLLQEAEYKLQQLKEAIDLLDRIGGDVDWAIDFCNFPSINEHLSSCSYALNDAHSELEEMYDRLEDEIESHKNDKAVSEAEFDRESNLRYFVKD